MALAVREGRALGGLRCGLRVAAEAKQRVADAHHLAAQLATLCAARAAH